MHVMCDNGSSPQGTGFAGSTALAFSVSQTQPNAATNIIYVHKIAGSRPDIGNYFLEHIVVK